MLRPLLAITALSLAIVASAHAPAPAAVATAPSAAPSSARPLASGILCTCQVECVATATFYFGLARNAIVACTNAQASCASSGCTSCENSDINCE
jgi:hypothetical protein